MALAGNRRAGIGRAGIGRAGGSERSRSYERNIEIFEMSDCFLYCLSVFNHGCLLKRGSKRATEKKTCKGKNANAAQ